MNVDWKEYTAPKHFVGFSNIEVDQTQPLPIKTDCAFAKLGILVGANGSGKTFILELSWFVQYIGAMLSVAHHNQGLVSLDDKQLVQTIFDHPFMAGEEISGSYKATTADKQYLEFALVNGKVQSLKYQLHPCGIGAPKFLSKEVRLFAPIDKFLSLKSRLAIDTQIVAPLGVDHEVHTNFPLYDCIAIEHIIKNITEKQSEIKNMISKIPFDVGGISRIFIEGNVVYAEMVNGSKRRASLLGAGHQAICVMSIASL